MSMIATNRGLVFTGNDFLRPRMAVENEKVKRYFPDFNFYATNGQVTSIQGYLKTSYGNRYYVKIEIPPNYPYSIPKAKLPYTTIDENCPHKYSSHDMCLMTSAQWSQTYSLAFVVAKTAIWLNKYDSWQRNGKRRWPGRSQHR